MSLRIANVITRMIVGGPQKVSLLAADYYRDMDGVEYHLVSGLETGPEGGYDREIASSRISYHAVASLVREVRPLYDLRALLALVRLFRRLRPHVVHARSAKARFVAPLAARLAGVPVVVQTVHGWSFNNAVDSRRRVFIWLERLASLMCECTVLVSQKDLTEGMDLGLIGPQAVDTGRATIIRSGIDLLEMKRQAEGDRTTVRESLGVRAGQRVLSLVQRLSEPKTPLVFVAAIREVMAARGEVWAWIVGDGPLRAETERAVMAAGLAGRVRFLGVRKDVVSLLGASDVVVHSSVREGLPRVVLEALAVGTPVVATDVGGVGDAIEHGRNGLLVPPRDPIALARAIEETLDQPGPALQRVEVGRRSVQAFSSRRMLEDQHALYRRLLARKGIFAPVARAVPS
jgi:glycosyltransferase involved in cell wall biosynthesis